MIEWIFILLLVICLYAVLSYYQLKREFEIRLQSELDLYTMKWRQDEERMVREDAIKRSESVIRGKITEHLMPFLPGFPYNPRDARFVGTPIDFIVFDGLSEDKLRKIIFVEVKTGKTGSLSGRERQVRDCVQNKEVVYKLLHNADTESGLFSYEERSEVSLPRSEKSLTIADTEGVKIAENKITTGAHTVVPVMKSSRRRITRCNECPNFKKITEEYGRCRLHSKYYYLNELSCKEMSGY